MQSKLNVLSAIGTQSHHGVKIQHWDSDDDRHLDSGLFNVSFKLELDHVCNQCI